MFQARGSHPPLLLLRVGNMGSSVLRSLWGLVVHRDFGTQWPPWGSQFPWFSCMGIRCGLGQGWFLAFYYHLGVFWLVLVTVLPGDSSANLSFGEGLLLLVREVVELVFLEAGLGAFFLSFSEDLAACVLAAFAGTVARLFELVCSFLFSTDVAVGELLILSKKTAASLASWDWRYSMHYFSSTIDV